MPKTWNDGNIKLQKELKTEEAPFILDTHDEIEDYNHEFYIKTHVFVDNAVDYYDEDQIYFESVQSS